MRHKTPAVVQHGNKATAPLGDSVVYETGNALDEQSLCEESGGIKLDGEEGIVSSDKAPMCTYSVHELRDQEQESSVGLSEVSCQDGYGKSESMRKSELTKQAQQTAPPTQFENISIAQAVMSSNEDMATKIAYCNMEQVKLQVCGQANNMGEGIPLIIRQDNDSMPIKAQNVVLGTLTEDLAKGWFHGAVQNGKDVWLCVHCGGTFGEKGNLARHIRIVHDKVKEHVCAECGKAFGQKGDLVKHIKTIHEQERLFLCPVCNKAFSEKGNMTRHMRTVHKALIAQDEKLLGKKRSSDQVEQPQEGVSSEEGQHGEKKSCIALPAQPAIITSTLMSLAHPMPTV